MIFNNNNINGWLCLDKPKGISSNFAMIKVRRIFEENTGYIGTLDPFATGVLPIAIGEVKKFIKYVDESEKIYNVVILFGIKTTTFDITGDIIQTSSKIPDFNAIKNVLKEFIGKISQIPPVFSAIKINGKRACDRTRNGELIKLSPRKIKIFDIKITNENLKNKEITLQVKCSKGSYMRTLASDIAEKLDSIACVKELHRTKSGFFSTENIISMDSLINLKKTDRLIDVLIPYESPLDDIPALYLEDEQIKKLQHGILVAVDSVGECCANIKIFGINQKFYGIGCITEEFQLKPVRMCII